MLRTTLNRHWSGGPDIREATPPQSDFQRLESAVRRIVAELQRYRSENRSLQIRCEEQSRKLRHVEQQLLDANQGRQEVARRLDEVIAQLEHLENEAHDAAHGERGPDRGVSVPVGDA